MSRSVLPFYANDISALARSLKDQLTTCDHEPGHVELLNMLARAIGCRNFQHFRAQLDARDRLNNPKPAPAPVDYDQLKRLVRYFDSAGRLMRWPSKFSHQQSCLWVLWSKLPPKQPLSEHMVNKSLEANHLFHDPALLRREMTDCGLVKRTADCREYRRVERQPSPEALALIKHVTASKRTASEGGQR